MAGNSCQNGVVRLWNEDLPGETRGASRKVSAVIRAAKSPASEKSHNQDDAEESKNTSGLLLHDHSSESEMEMPSVLAGKPTVALK